MVRSDWPLVIPRPMAASGEGDGRSAGGPRRKKESASVGLTRVTGEGILLTWVPRQAHGVETALRTFADAPLPVSLSPSQGNE
jgi:hypothetical protein